MMSSDFNIKLRLVGPYDLIWPCHPLFYTPPHLKIKVMRHDVLFFFSVTPSTSINFILLFRYNFRTTVRTLRNLSYLFSSSLIRETASLELRHLNSSLPHVRILTNGFMHAKFKRHLYGFVGNELIQKTNNIE